MASVLLTVLFSFAAIAAIHAIILTWRRYGGLALALPRQLRDCPQQRDFRWSTTDINVTRAPAKVLRASFKPAARVVNALPVAA